MCFGGRMVMCFLREGGHVSCEVGWTCVQEGGWSCVQEGGWSCA